MLTRVFLVVFGVLLFMACQNEKSGKASFEVDIRLDNEPGNINPFLAPTSRGREVYQYVFLPLADFHPDDLELYPILIKEIPVARDTVIDDEALSVFEMEFKDDAEWSDGTKLSNRDFFLTVHLIKHPLSEAAGWKPYYDVIRQIDMHPENPQKFKVYTRADYMLGLEVATTGFIVPSHVFDSTGVFNSIGVSDYDNDYEVKDSLEKEVVEYFNASVTQKIEILQNGPYRITEFQTDEYYILDAVDDFWGKNYPDNVFLDQNPSRIIMRIVPDEITALNMAKEEKLDFIRLKNSDRFLEVQQDTSYSKEWTFHTPQIMQYYYIAMNNKSALLSDKKMRQAMSHLADVDDFIENIEGGLGVRTVGPFHPSKPYYNKSLEPWKFDIDKAEQLLEESGWVDSDGNGIRDKIVEGKKQELSLDFYITGSELAQKIALLFQKAAQEAEVEVEIITKPFALLNRENLATYDYHFAALAQTTDANPDDPYSKWHSDNAQPGMRNQVGYENAEADVIIEKIRGSLDVKERKKYYMELQEILYDDQAVIFLYSPFQKIMIHSDIKAQTSAKRPGYFANSFELN